MGVTLLLIAITAAASFYAWKNQTLYHQWMMNPYKVKNNNEYLRFLASGFIHADAGHLFFNMFSLYFMGDFLDRVFEGWFGALGMLYYVALYLVGIVVANIPTYFKHKNDYGYNALGASGGVSAVIFSFIMIAPTQTIYLYFIPVPAFIFGVLYLIYSYMQAKKEGDNINHDAHFYGALFGVIYTIGIMPEVVAGFFSQIANWKIF